MNKDISASLNWWLALVVLVIVSFTTRLYVIQVPNAICWDEFHFTKMSASYINRRFFFDIHPPLGKILLSLVGYFSNYKEYSEHNKTVGEPYSTDFPYIEQRMFCSLLSSVVPVVCYCVVWMLTTSFRASLISATFVMFDNSLILIGRLIILDSMLIFFLFISFFCYIKSQSQKILSKRQVAWLILTGLCLGIEISIKLVGIFTMLFYILCSLFKIWNLLPEKSFKLFNLAKLCGFYIMTLVIIPSMVYVGAFVVHFRLLKYSGPGDHLFSASFQSHLHGNMFSNLFLSKYVTYNSDVVLRNVGGRRYLNHPSQVDCRLLDGMVTTFAIMNEEASWKLMPFLYKKKELVHVLDGDVMLLKHSRSSKLMKTYPSSVHSSLDVSCTEETDQVDENQFYRIKFVTLSSSENFFLDDINGESGLNPGGKRSLQPLRHIFYLEDVNNDCFLSSTERPLIIPGHKLVTCSASLDENSLWYIEWIVDERVNKEEMNINPMTFWSKFIETHIVMFKANGELEPAKDDSNSFPWQWFFNIPGQPILGPDYVVYLLGTPIVWWMSSALLFLFLITLIIITITKQRGHALLTNELHCLLEKNLLVVIAWFLHYSPFFLMTRPLYFHHYLPAAVFKLMASGVTIHCFLRMIEDYSCTLFTPSITVVLLAVVSANFKTFSILTYGFDTTQNNSEKTLTGLRWTTWWKF